MQNNCTYRWIASNAVLSRWAKDGCRAGGRRTSCDRPPCRWIYGFPVPSAGMDLACALSSEALQLLPPISRCGSSPCLCRGCNLKPPFLGDFWSFAKQMVPATEYLYNHSAHGPSWSCSSAGCPAGFPHLPFCLPECSMYAPWEQPQIQGDLQLDFIFFFLAYQSKPSNPCGFEGADLSSVWQWYQ